MFRWITWEKFKECKNKIFTKKIKHQLCLQKWICNELTAQMCGQTSNWPILKEVAARAVQGERINVGLGWYSIRVSRTTCYSAGKGKEVTGINSLWLKKSPRLLQWIKQWNVAERAGNTLSLFTLHNEEMLMADLSSIFCLNFVWTFLCFQNHKEAVLNFRLFTGIMKLITLCHRILNDATDWVTDTCASCACRFEWA